MGKKKEKLVEPKRKKYSFYDRYWNDDGYYGYDEDDAYEPSAGGTTAVTPTPGYKSPYGGYSYGGYSGYSGYSGYGGYSYGGSSYYSSSYGRSSYSYTSYYDRYRSTFGGTGLGACLSHGTDFTGPASVMAKAYKEARDLVIILDFPQTVHLSFSASDGVEKGKFIFLETEVLSDTAYTPEEQINIICGLAVHEACHLKYSTYRVAKHFYDIIAHFSSGDFITTEESKEIDVEGISAANAIFLRLIFNLIEDMRVEHELLEERPGYSSVLQTEKDYRFKQYSSYLSKKTMKDKDAAELLDVLVRLIRFPDEVEEEKVEKFSEIYEKLSEAMNPLPKSTKESCTVALKMFREVHKYFKDLRGLSDCDINSLLHVFSSTLLSDTTAFLNIMYGSDSSSDVDSVKTTMEKFGAICDDLRTTTASGMVMGTVETGKDDRTFFMKPEGDKSIYLSIKDEVSKFVPAMRKIVFGIDKNYEFEEKGCRSGLLDTTKLAEAYQGVPQVYVRKGEVKTNKVAIGILIDESGSMCWGLDKLARSAAVLLNEALKDCPGVELFIYGHTADQNFNGSTEINIYREGKTYSPEFSLSSSRAHYENRDGTAIFEVANRIRERTTNKAIMIVLSDGSPSAASYRGHDAETDTRKKVQQVEKMGIQVIQVTIGPVHNVDYMFSRYIDLQFDLNRLPIELSKVVKKLIVDNKVTTIC